MRKSMVIKRSCCDVTFCDAGVCATYTQLFVVNVTDRAQLALGLSDVTLSVYQVPEERVDAGCMRRSYNSATLPKTIVCAKAK